MTDPTAQQLAIAREIFIEGRKISDSPDREVERIASILAKHQEPASEREGELSGAVRLIRRLCSTLKRGSILRSEAEQWLRQLNPKGPTP